MRFDNPTERKGKPGAKRSDGPRPRRRGILVAIVGVALALWCTGQSGSRAGTQAPAPVGDKPAPSVEPTGKPGPDPLQEGKDRQSDDRRAVAADPAEREKQLAADKAELLRLAVELKKEIDRSGTGTLSVTVIRRAEEIEKLAQRVKQEMNRNLKPAS